MRIAYCLAAFSTIIASMPASATEPANLRTLPVTKPVISRYGTAPKPQWNEVEAVILRAVGK